MLQGQVTWAHVGPDDLAGVITQVTSIDCFHTSTRNAQHSGSPGAKDRQVRVSDLPPYGLVDQRLEVRQILVGFDDELGQLSGQVGEGVQFGDRQWVVTAEEIDWFATGYYLTFGSETQRRSHLVESRGLYVGDEAVVAGVDAKPVVCFLLVTAAPQAAV